MFSFIRKESLCSSCVMRRSVDCHNHILPLIDDGVRTVNEAIDILNYYENEGVEHVIFTPHINKRFPDNSYDSIKYKFNEFVSVYEGGIKLGLAAEYMLDSDFEKHFLTKRILTLFSDHILLELPVTPPFNLINRIQDIVSAGYFVVLAHPERYLYLDERRLQLLKDNNIRFQLNLFSLLGMYGKKVQNRAKAYLKNGLYDCFGSDLHSSEMIDNMAHKCLTNSMIKSLMMINKGIYN